MTTPEPAPVRADFALQVYLLGVVDFDAVLRFQRRLQFDVSGDRGQAALIVCEHPPVVTVGRQGHYADLRCDLDELRARRWGLRWVNRGGGCCLHLPGQLAIYPILPLDRLGLNVATYVTALAEALRGALGEFSIPGAVRCSDAGVLVGNRLVAALGVAVHDWVSSYGAYLNVNPDLDHFRVVQCVGAEEPMTSLERERRGPVRPSLVRERVIEHFTRRFGFGRTSLFSDHPALQAYLQTGAKQRLNGVSLDR